MADTLYTCDNDVCAGCACQPEAQDVFTSCAALLMPLCCQRMPCAGNCRTHGKCAEVSCCCRRCCLPGISTATASLCQASTQTCYALSQLRIACPPLMQESPLHQAAQPQHLVTLKSPSA
jgi:hypothetical protein